MDLGLSGQTLVVTGGASGIGRATTDLLRSEGANVAVLDLAAGQDIASKPVLRGYAVDITDFAALEQTADRVERDLGPVDVVVHCAAIGSGRFGFPFTNLTPADWTKVLEVNVMGTVHVGHVFGPRLRDRRSGAMVFLASVAGQIGSQTDPPYSASKAAVINFAQCLAKDLAPHNVRVNTICPGMVQTPLNEGVWRAWHDQQRPEDRLSYEEWAGRKIRQIVPLGRWQAPEDVANMIAFLCSPRAGNVTGQTINVDGGFVMHW
jgi:2-hydroxycyclohexanecarboxyl-CoA dehydrogenase